MDTRQPAATPPAPLDVILGGVYYCDLIFTDLPQMPQLGQEIFGGGFDMMPGGAYNVAIALHRLGLKVGWHCEFGSDFISRFVLDAARVEGLDERFFFIHDGPLRNLTVSLSFAEDRAFVTYADRPNLTSVAGLWDAEPAKAVVLPILYYQPDLLVLSEKVHSSGGLLLMDCAQLEPGVRLDTPGVLEALGAVDIFAPNETEALQLTQKSTVADALDVLAGLTPLVVLKQGADGAAARKGDDHCHVPALPDLQPVDTTGAGDCFNAGFLSGWLRGESLERCLQRGNIVGGLSTLARGTQHTPALAEVERYLAAHYPDRTRQDRITT